MAGRIRSIKPELLEDEIAAGLSDPAWRLWVSLWVLADDHGDVRASPRYLAAQVWHDTNRDAETPLQELIDKGRVHPYAVAGQRYLRVHAWARHQRVDNASKPRVPLPEEDDGTWDQGVPGRFAENRGESPRDSENRGDSPNSAASRTRANPRAHSRRQTPTPTTTPTTDPEGDPPRIAANVAVEDDGSAPPPGKKRGTRLSPDWTPSPATVARFRDREHIDALASLERFKNTFLSKTGHNATKLDWDLTFTNWVIEDIRRGVAKAIVTPPPETRIEVPPDVVSAEEGSKYARQVFDLLSKTDINSLTGKDKTHGRS